MSDPGFTNEIILGYINPRLVANNSIIRDRTGSAKLDVGHPRRRCSIGGNLPQPGSPTWYRGTDRQT